MTRASDPPFGESIPEWDGPTYDDVKAESRQAARIQVANIVFTNYTGANLPQMVEACTFVWNWVQQADPAPAKSDDVQ